MNKLLAIILVFSFLFSEKCFESWFSSNISDDKLYLIEGVINKRNSIKIFIENNKRYKIEYLDKIIINDNVKVSSYSKETNQLFIENSDKNFNNFIYSFLDIDKFKNKIKKINLNKILLKKTPYGNVNIIFNTSCSDIDSLVFKKDKDYIKISQIIVTHFNDLRADSLFSFDFNGEDVFEYDFR